MSLYSYSTLSSSSSSNNSYRLLSSSSSITNVSSQSDTERRNSITDDEQSWPAAPKSETIVQNQCRIEKNVRLVKDQQSLGRNSIIKATMIKDHILLQNSSSTPMTIIPGKHIFMKVAFKF